MSETLWPIPPNWAQGVNETLEWLTSVADSPAGVEQRMSLRTHPRRRIDYSALVTDTDRAFFDNLVSAAGSSVFLLPLWFDRFELTAQLNAGSTTVFMTTAVHEYVAGGSAVAVFGPGPRDNEIVGVNTVLADRITLVAPTASNWPIGTVLHPLTAARLQEQPKASRRSDRVWDVTLSFTASRYNPWATTLWTPTTYRSYPVLTTAPDDVAARQTEFQRIMEVIDSGFAEVLHVDTAGAGLRRQAHAWMTHGLVENAEFRAFLYALRGRQKALWLPTFTADFDLVEPVDSADTTLVVARCGFTDIQGVVDNRRDIQISLTNGTVLYRRITGAAIIGGNERLTIDSAVGQDIAIDDIRRISIMSMGRLDGDGVEIVHHTDIEGASTCAAVFRMFLDQREATAWVPYTPSGGEAPPAPADLTNVIARMFFSTSFDSQYASRIYPLSVNGVLHTGSAPGMTFVTGGALEYSGAAVESVLFLELIATDDSLVPLPRAEQPTKWEIVSAVNATVKNSVDRNTYLLYRPTQTPTYAGIRVSFSNRTG